MTFFFKRRKLTAVCSFYLIFNCVQDSDFCSPNPCSNGGKCEHDALGFVCKCPKGYSGDTCERGKLYDFFTKSNKVRGVREGVCIYINSFCG